MSETETHIGKCELLFKGTDKEIEAFCEKRAERFSILSLSEYTTWREVMIDEMDGEWVFIDDKIYVIIEDIFTDSETFKAVRNKDCTISYVLQYYNGCCCFDEALENALENMEE